MAIEEYLKPLLEEKFKDADFHDYFLIEIKHNITNNKVEVFVDSDSGVTIEQCAKLNRYLQNHIDEKGWLGEKYVLDVSSPGISNPLISIRQYKKNIGRNIKLKLTDGTKEEGKLTKVEEGEIVIEKEVITKQGKKKIKEIVETSIDLRAIEKALITISFK